MKSIERRFNNSKESRPWLSNWANFAIAITKSGFSESTIRRWFYKLVPKEEYESKDKQDIFAYLMELSNAPRTTEIDTKRTPGEE